MDGALHNKESLRHGIDIIDIFQIAQVLIKKAQMLDLASFSGFVHRTYPQFIHNFVENCAILPESLKNKVE